MRQNFINIGLIPFQSSKNQAEAKALHTMTNEIEDRNYYFNDYNVQNNQYKTDCYKKTQREIQSEKKEKQLQEMRRFNLRRNSEAFRNTSSSLRRSSCNSRNLSSRLSQVKQEQMTQSILQETKEMENNQYEKRNENFDALEETQNINHSEIFQNDEKIKQEGSHKNKHKVKKEPICSTKYIRALLSHSKPGRPKNFNPYIAMSQSFENLIIEQKQSQETLNNKQSPSTNSKNQSFINDSINQKQDTTHQQLEIEKQENVQKLQKKQRIQNYVQFNSQDREQYRNNKNNTGYQDNSIEKESNLHTNKNSDNYVKNSDQICSLSLKRTIMQKDYTYLKKKEYKDFLEQKFCRSELQMKCEEKQRKVQQKQSGKFNQNLQQKQILQQKKQQLHQTICASNDVKSKNLDISVDSGDAVHFHRNRIMRIKNENELKQLQGGFGKNISSKNKYGEQIGALLKFCKNADLDALFAKFGVKRPKKDENVQNMKAEKRTYNDFMNRRASANYHVKQLNKQSEILQQKIKALHPLGMNIREAGDPYQPNEVFFEINKQNLKRLGRRAYSVYQSYYYEPQYNILELNMSVDSQEMNPFLEEDRINTQYMKGYEKPTKKEDKSIQQQQQQQDMSQQQACTSEALSNTEKQQHNLQTDLYVSNTFVTDQVQLEYQMKGAMR